MTLSTTVLLGAIAGFTIYIGLPVARLKNPPRSLQAFLNALATGILIFLLWDVLTKASDPIQSSIGSAQSGKPGTFISLVILFFFGIGVGLLGLVLFERRMIKRAGGEVAPRQLALMIATGIGLHNFSEGLAIGQASKVGAIALATMLIVGFGLHNTTEGFGIAAPLAAVGAPATWGFLGFAGLIGGGPTFVGTLLGYAVRSNQIFVLFLALAAGSILYVVSELLYIGRRFALREVAMFGVFLGFVAGYGTDLVLTWAGA